jgi:CHAT domain-containing protein/tetratricopeptide (TPR) repeat protein
MSRDPFQDLRRLRQQVVRLYKKSRFHEAIEPAIRARDLARRTYGQGHPRHIDSLKNLAMLYQAIGDYGAAEPLYREAMEFDRAIGGDYSDSLHSLAGLYQAKGDYAAAKPLFQQADEVRRLTLRAARPNSAVRLINLAMVHQAMGDYAALSLCRQAVEIARAALGEDHPDYAVSLNNLAMAHQAMGDYAAALPLCRQAAEIRRAELGEDHRDYAQSLNNLAMVHQAMGDYPTALTLHQQAAEITRAAVGEGHPDYAQSLHGLAMVLTAYDRAAEALPLLQQTAAIDDRMIGQVLSIGSERQRIAFLQTLWGRFYLTLSLVLERFGRSPAAVCAAFDLVLRRKAIAAEATAAQHDAVLGGKYPALRPGLQELVALRMQVARATLDGPGPEGTEAHRRRLAEWSAQKERLESELARQVPEMNLERKLRAADRRAVALALPEGVALVEFVRFPIADFHAVAARGEKSWQPERYLAFVLRAGDPDEPRMIDLGEAEPIERMIADFRAGVIAEAGDHRNMARRRDEASPTTASDPALALRVALFDKLVPALGDHTRLFLAPDGDLARLPFEILPTADGRRLIDDYQISYLSCGRDVLRFGVAATAKPAAPMILADPDFDLERLTVREPAQPGPGFWARLIRRGKRSPATPEPPVPMLATDTRSTGRRSRDLDRDQGAFRFHRLPGTRAEGQRLAAMLGVAPWLDATALEGRLKTACRSPRILHLATHGFFLPDQERDPNREGRGFGFDFGEFTGSNDGLGRLAGPMMENPMLRSGLVLAGANTWLKAGNLPEEAEDGLLTAEDVTGLDLLATELVVLSACETGLGRVHVGEGVFGLRRAFVLAGARTLVMSLWKVPDEPTRELMEDFYRRLLAGEGRAEALRQAQLALKAKYPEPFYWGAFICQGDPSPLSKVESKEDRYEAVAG